MNEAIFAFELNKEYDFKSYVDEMSRHHSDVYIFMGLDLSEDKVKWKIFSNIKHKVDLKAAIQNISEQELIKE